jgi:hypothetical protein
MKYFIALIPLSLAACAPSYAAPVQRMADAQSAHRAAIEAGAEKDPQAQLHLKLAEEQFAKAKTLLEQDENRRADFLLIRSKADAELALAMAQEKETREAAEQARAKTAEETAPNTQQGAVPTAGGVQP